MKQTPYWTKDKAIKLSGADQIILVLKTWLGGWRKYYKRESLLDEIHGKKGRDLKHIDRIRAFERKHKVQFIVKGNHVVGYKQSE